MTGAFVVVLVLTFSVGAAREPLEIVGRTGYPDLATCLTKAQQAASWLTQDFVTVKPFCKYDAEARQLTLETEGK